MEDQPKKPKVDIPVGGIYDSLLRSFGETMHVATTIPIYILAAMVMGAAFIPSVYLFEWVSNQTQYESGLIRAFGIGFSIAGGYLLYGFSMLLLVPIVNAPVLKFFKPTRGPFRSVQVFPWYLHNALVYVVRYTFLEFVTPTPFSIWFYRAMGMKIGKGVYINTTHISDPGLIVIEDHVTIGGSATIIAHNGSGGYLVLSPTIIRRRATIGLRAIIMADVEVGEGAKVLPNSVVLPKTRIPAGEVWAGIPAKKIELE